MIPKIIHYCWFGGKEKPKAAIKCIKSWKKYCPDYEIVEWNESNFDLNYNPYVREAYEKKKWAFITDVVRLFALVKYGGIYMDTDVELLKNPESILSCRAVSGFENNHSIPTGFMAAEKGFDLFEELLKEYDDIHFVNEDGSLDMTSNVIRITNTCLKYGLVQNDKYQVVRGFVLLPHEYLCPKDHNDGKIYLTKNTIAIHHFAGSWVTKKSKIRTKLVRISYRIFGRRITNFLRRKFGNKK